MLRLPFVVRAFVAVATLWLALHVVGALVVFAAGVFFGVSGGRHG